MTDRDSAARLYRNARREAVLVMFVWALALTWTVGYCYLRGYRHDPDAWVVRAGLAVPADALHTELLWGLPDWIWVGIVLPWLLCSAFTAGFCLGMTDDDLGAEPEGDLPDGH